MESMNAAPKDRPEPTDVGEFPDSDRGYAAHWSRVGPQLDSIRRQELREHGPKPYDWRIVDSLLQLGYVHGNRNPPTHLIQWQQRIAAAYAKQIRHGGKS